MVEGNDAFTLDARRALLGRPHCVLNMVEGNDAFTLDARRALKGRPHCVLNMVEGNDAVTLDARRALKGRPHCVLNMVEAYDVPIASHGPILDAVKRAMMAIVPPVSNISFQRTHEARLFMPIPKRSVFVTRSMNILRDLSMTSLCIQVIVIAP
jgi:hypothetical protein